MTRLPNPRVLDERPRWRRQWASDGPLHLRVDAADVSDEAGQHTLHRVATGAPDTEAEAAGAVIVALRGGADPAGQERSVIMVRAQRMAPGVELWELPRGSADADDRSLAEVALRELCEETGLEASDAEMLGLIYSDSGILADATGVVVASVPAGAEGHPADGENEDVIAVAWRDLPTLIADGRLRDGISLSALALASVALGEAR